MQAGMSLQCTSPSSLLASTSAADLRAEQAQSSLSELHGQNLYVEPSPAAVQRGSSPMFSWPGPAQPQYRPSVLGSYLAPPSWVPLQLKPVSFWISSNSSTLFGKAVSSQPLRAAHTVSQLAPPLPFTHVTPAADLASRPTQAAAATESARTIALHCRRRLSSAGGETA